MQEFVWSLDVQRYRGPHCFFTNCGQFYEFRLAWNIHWNFSLLYLYPSAINCQNVLPALSGWERLSFSRGRHQRHVFVCTSFRSEHQVKVTNAWSTFLCRAVFGAFANGARTSVLHRQLNYRLKTCNWAGHATLFVRIDFSVFLLETAWVPTKSCDAGRMESRTIVTVSSWNL